MEKSKQSLKTITPKQAVLSAIKIFGLEDPFSLDYKKRDNIKEIVPDADEIFYSKERFNREIIQLEFETGVSLI